MRKTRLTLTAAAALAVLVLPSSASAATTTTTQDVTGAGTDVLTVAVTTAIASPMVLQPGGTGTAVTTVTVTDTTPSTPHSLTIHDAATTPAGHTAGYMDNTSLVPAGATKLANPLEWSLDNTVWSAVQGSQAAAAAVITAAGTATVDPYVINFRQRVNSNEDIRNLQTFGLTATYTATS